MAAKTTAALTVSLLAACTCVAGLPVQTYNGRDVGDCTLSRRQGYTLRYIDVSVLNPVTAATETLRVLPGNDTVAYATVNAAHGSDVTVAYVFDSVVFAPVTGANPFCSNAVTWLGYVNGNHTHGECLDARDLYLSQQLPNGTQTYTDDRDHPRVGAYVKGLFVAHDSNRTLTGFKLAVTWFTATDYPSACGPASTHGIANLTQCIVPDVLLPAAFVTAE